MSHPRKPFETCPSCGEQDSIFLMYGPYVKLDSTPGRDRIPAFCNNTRCDQRYWYYPRSAIGAYITRRNTGVTYKEWRIARVDIATVNSARRAERLPLLVRIVDMKVGETVPVGETGPEQIMGERTVYGWWRWLRAAVGSLKSFLPKSKTNGDIDAWGGKPGDMP